MRKTLRIVGAVVLFGLICFGGGWFLQLSKVSAANRGQTACNDKLKTIQAGADKQEAILYLYRARIELTRNNFGTAGDDLGEAKNRVPGSPALEEIDKASKAVMGQDLATATDSIQNAIRALEGAPAPQGSPTP